MPDIARNENAPPNPPLPPTREPRFMHPSIIINFNHHTLLPRPTIRHARRSSNSTSTRRPPTGPITALLEIFFLLDMPFFTHLEDDRSGILQPPSPLQLLPHFDEEAIDHEVLRPGVGVADGTFPLVGEAGPAGVLALSGLEEGVEVETLVVATGASARGEVEDAGRVRVDEVDGDGVVYDLDVWIATGHGPLDRQFGLRTIPLFCELSYLLLIDDLNHLNANRVANVTDALLRRTQHPHLKMVGSFANIWSEIYR